ncbi:hypothetical protein IGI04_026748, partial [Brassica rapa subsp. trilocularis]
MGRGADDIKYSCSHSDNNLTVAKQYSARQRIPPPPETAEKPFRALIFDRFNMYLLVCGIFWEMNHEKMEAIDLNDDGQNDVMDEDIEDHEVLEDSEANRGTQPRQVQSRRKVSRCWRKFTILGGRLSDGTTKIRCNLCRRFYFLNLRRNGTSTL